jgi:RNA polymerase sigma-70 factor (ECF subfamily)
VLSIEELPVPDLPEPALGVEASLSRKEEQQRVRLVLETLDPIDRAAVVMYYWYDFSYEEICQALSLTMSAVKSRLHRARRAMAEEWMHRQAVQPVSGDQMPMRKALQEPILAERITS